MEPPTTGSETPHQNSHSKRSPGRGQLKVLIADDHAIVRAGLKQLLSECPDVSATDEATNSYEALKKIREHNWDVVLLDISMPEKIGLETLKQIKSERPTLAVLVLSMHAEGPYALRALKAGAAGYLTKECIPEQLLEAVTKVAEGGKYITPALAEKLACALDSSVMEAPHEALSNRELQVFQLLATGKQVGQIGKVLSLSTKTVSAHRANILKKMQMKNNAELMFYAIDNDLVSRDQIVPMVKKPR
ncbi:Two-component transcriptional response regulator, LuxR family [hydrothermal vent metagenome]|uniref:Two-component transcriptional response regulator, LuxR family n=1 Tax=hydrothermal vent metagenome TaxID=652676 RepID=A0A3B0YSN6_9ZZZZ